MAEYVVVDKEQLEADLTTVADAIRGKGGTTEPLAFPQGMASAVEAIQSGGSEEFMGIKHSDFSEHNLPQVVDARHVKKPIADNVYNVFYSMFVNASINYGNGFYHDMKMLYLPDWIVSFPQAMCQHCINLEHLIGDFGNVLQIDNSAFTNCYKLKEIPYMPKLKTLNGAPYRGCSGLLKACFYNTLTTFSTNTFTNCYNLLDIYVPWSEGEVANAPWGAANATIHYNTVYDENHNPIIQEV